MWFLSLLLFLQAMIYSPPRREGWIILQNIFFGLTYCCWYYEVQNIERSGGDCSHCLTTTTTFQKMNLIEIIESPSHYQKWPLQHDKTLGKVFFANPLIIAPPTNPEHWKWYWNKFQQYFPQRKRKLWFLLLKNPLIYANVHIPGNSRNQSFSSIWYCHFNSMHISEYVGDPSPSLQWRKVKNIFQTRPCSKVDVEPGLKYGSLFLLLKY